MATPTIIYRKQLTNRRHLTPKQQELLIEALENQPALIADDGLLNKSQRKALWDDLSHTISREPTDLTVDGQDLKHRWMKWKSRVRSKALQLKKNTNEPPGSSPSKLTPLEKRVLLAIGDSRMLDLEESLTTILDDTHVPQNQVPVELLQSAFITDGHMINVGTLKVEPLPIDEFVEEPVRGHDVRTIPSISEVPPKLTPLEKRLLLAVGDSRVLDVEKSLTPVLRDAHESQEQVPVEMMESALAADGHMIHVSALKVEPLPTDEFEEEPVEGHDVHSISAVSEVMSSTSIQTSPASAEDVSHGVQPDILMHCHAGSSAFVAPAPQNMKNLRIQEEEEPSLTLLHEVAQQQQNMSRVMENIECAVQDQVAAIREQSRVMRETSREQTAAIREQSEVLRQTNTILREFMSALFKNGLK